MRDLTAQVTSSLLRFPEVTIQALGEDEITLESVLRGRFTAGRNGLACLACGPQLEVVNSITGERLSAYRFSGINEQPPTVLVVKEFSWQKRTGLLIGLEETEGSVLCLYDLGISRVVKAVVLPGRVTAIEPIINHGGASASTQHLHQSLRWLFGVAAVVTDVGQVLLIDLCLDDLSCSQNEIEASDLEVITGIPTEVPHIREDVTREGRHLCFQLLSPSGTAISALTYISRTNQLAAGFSDGCLALWNMKTLKKEYYAQLEGGRVPVYAVTFQEPENDPRNCCYLWAVQSTQDCEGDLLSLHLLQLAFGDRKCLASGQILYEGLEYCEERYSLDLTGGISPLRGQTSNTKLLGCQSIEKFRSHVDREESMNEVLSPDTSVSVFSWQVNTYGQGKPSTYLGLFDINRWYHAQMPDSLRPGEFLHNCSYFALWSLDSVVSKTSPNCILDISVHERSLNRGVPPSYPPPEQFFNPSTYNFDATCLLNSGIIHLTCTGFQKETLTFLKKSGPSLNEAIPDNYNRCLVAGLLSPRLIDVQPSSLSQEEQLEAILSAAVQTSSLGLLTGCIKRWTTEEQPSSAANLRFVLEWTWNKVVFTKEEFDRICASLFDGSCHFIDPQTIQSLQHCQLLFSNLSTVLNCFLSEAQELTERGLVDLTNKQMVTNLISQYAQVVLWFSRSGLLPEGLDDPMQLSRLWYNYPVIQSYYTSRRQKLQRLARGKWNADCLMIDGMLSQLGDRIEKLWQRDEGGTGKYPPASLHALLDVYLLENIDETNKHAITIYLLLDIIYSFPNKTDTSVESFPTAFAIPWGLVKLIQGFWLIDHNDYESALDLLFHPATIKSMTWQHTKIIQAFMCQGEHKLALRYIQTMKPSVSSSNEVMLHLTVLLFNRCMVEAWSLLRQHSNRLNVEELLKHMYEACQEMGLMEDLLKLPFTETEQECLVKFLQSNAGVQNHELLLIHHLQRANYIPALQLNQSLKVNLMNDRDPRLRERSVARNSILDQYGKILPRVQRKLAMERAKPYHLSSSVFREVSRPKPLSTVAKQTTTGTVLTRAAFINNVLSKIGEVWVGNELKNNLSPYNSPKIEEISPVVYSLPDTDLPDAFVGTPITKASEKVSRLLDLVVRPIPQASPNLEYNQVTPARAMVYITSNSLPSTAQLTGFPDNITRASELNLLETPLVVKRAKALATSIATSGYPEFTPHSILRSSLRTPLASPSGSPGRSVTPPPRPKETRISFMEEDVTTKWNTGVTEESKAKLIVSSPLHKCGVHSENVWPKSKNKTSPLVSSGGKEEHEEAIELAQNAPTENTEKLEVTKENSSISVKLAQTTLEDEDTPLPDDFEDEDDVIFIFSKPADTSANLNGNLEEQKEDGKEDIEPKVISTDTEQQINVLKEDENKLASVLSSETSELNPSSSVSEPSPCALSEQEREIFTQEPKLPLLDEKQLSDEICTTSVGSTVASNEPMMSVLHSSENSLSSTSETPATSENSVIQEIALDLKEDREIEVDVPEENADLPEEKPSVSNSFESQEMNVIEHEKVEPLASEEESGTLSLNELYPSRTLKLPYNFDTIEQQFTCDLPENKDSVECDMAEVDGEIFVAQSNFTLILEGEEGEIETDCITSDASTKTANIAAGKEKVYKEDSVNHGHVKNLASVKINDQKSQNVVETLPYVPEPIKVAIAENLLDVIKDTRNKEFASDTVEQTILETMPLITQKVLRSTKAEDTSLVDLNDSQDNDMTPSRTRTRGQSIKNLKAKAPEEESSAISTPDTLELSTIKRSTRKTKEKSEISENAYTETDAASQKVSLDSTPRRGRKKKINLDTLKLAIEQELQDSTPSRRELRTRSSQLSESSNEETSHTKEVKLASATKRTSRRTKKSVEELESNEIVNDQDIKLAASPARSRRKLRSVNIELTENVGPNPDTESSEKHPVQQSERSRRVNNTSETTEHSKLDLSELTFETEFKTPATPKKRGRPRRINTLDKEIEETPLTPEEKQTPLTPRRSARITSGKNDNNLGKLTLENNPLSPDEGLTTTLRSKRKLTKVTENQRRKTKLHSISEGSTDEEIILKNSKSKEILHADSDLTKSRNTRTRSSKTIVFPNFSDPQTESFLFSSPVSKVTRKTRAQKIETTVELKGIVSDLSSQFVFSPPTVRTTRKQASELSRIVKELELPIENDPKSVETTDKRKVKRIRTTKTKASKTTEKEGSWSPPPVEIKLISPLATPVDATKNKSRKATEATEKTLGRSRRKLSSFPKQVLRRKML
ncbi:protein ELYS isoform X1 [Monodelphis domestica]|uniref:AT-hook containing transcription factor 1 n=2 Tax=Monodelphis domestica TaxID=13616 RepID=F7BR05_MONDO|nr:protein ELYS isoform X1 [Monodelphis domestica]XP_007481578.1 protein ELYS isoform X1 [Monodelphis domestica]XP_056672024.1 protein ELYS isoform X1 [Monodelphis domestica]XP_056672025.1 protein ELYS isoform X1 [Monodelphis domestica]XP_056672026.1 protein ELYS isoform X1 [Monodelphis domestica]